MKMPRLSIGLAMITLSAPLIAGEVALSLAQEFHPAIGGTDALELADVDGNGTLDAIVVSKAAARYACYRGAGDGTFGAQIFSGQLLLEPSDLTVGDFDSDGHQDIAAINSACG